MKNYDEEEKLTAKEFCRAAYSEICAALVAAIHTTIILEGIVFDGLWQIVGLVLLFLFETSILLLCFIVFGTLWAKEHKYDTLKEQRKFLFIILPLILMAIFFVYVSYLKYK